MRAGKPARAEAASGAVSGDPVDRLAALETIALLALAEPGEVRASTATACSAAIALAGQPAEVYARALGTLAALVYARPDLLNGEAADALERLFTWPPLTEATYRPAAEVLGLLLGTPAADRAVEVLLNLLSTAGRSPAAYGALLEALRYAAFWAIARLDLETVLGLAEVEHLAEWRGFLLEHVVERLVLAEPGAVTGPILERLARLYGESPAWSFVLAYLAASDATEEARRARWRGGSRCGSGWNVGWGAGHGGCWWCRTSAMDRAMRSCGWCR